MYPLPSAHRCKPVAPLPLCCATCKFLDCSLDNSSSIYTFNTHKVAGALHGDVCTCGSNMYEVHKMKEFPIRPTVLRPLLTGSGKRRDIGDQAEERVAHIFALDGLYNIQVSDKNQLWCLTSEWKSARSMGKRVFEFIQKQSKGYPTMLRSATNVDLRDIEPQFRIRKYETLVTISSCPESMNMSEMSLQDSLDKAYESLAKDDETRHERCDLFAEHIAAKPEAEAEAEAKAGVEVEKAEAERLRLRG